MDTVSKLQEISQRLDHLEMAGDWLAEVLAGKDSSAAQTGTLISILAEDIRARLLQLVTELETRIALQDRTH